MIFYAFSVHYAHTGYLADQHHVPFFEPGVFGFIESAAVSLQTICIMRLLRDYIYQKITYTRGNNHRESLTHFKTTMA